MRAALVAFLAAVIVFFGVSASAQAQEIPECGTVEAIPLVEVCALQQGSNVVIMLNGNEVMTIKVEMPVPPTVPPPVDNPSDDDPADPPPGQRRQPAPTVTVTRIPAPATVVVPGPTSTKTVTVRPPSRTTTITPSPKATPLTVAEQLENLPPGAITVERAVTFGVGALLLLMVLAALGLAAAYALGYRHSEKQAGNKLAQLRNDVFGGKHR